jgi:hypothetical protein
MNLKLCTVLSAILLVTAPLDVLAGSLWCQGNIVEANITEKQLLEACGEPASRNGANWIYRAQGNLSTVVNVENGVVMFIRDATDEDSSALPFGDPP